ncbi:MAG: sulfotransferase domain-containing protein [Acidobacteriota bacterium]
MTGQSKAVLWVLGVFATGVLFGGAVSFFAVRSGMPPPPIEVGPTDPGQAERPETPAAGPPVEAGEEARSFQRPDRPSGRPTDLRHNPMGDIRRLARYLELTPQQRGQVRQIMQETTQQFQAANKQQRLRQHQIRSNMMRSLRTILTPEQKERFDEFIRSRPQRKRRPPQDRRRGTLPQRQPR